MILILSSPSPIEPKDKTDKNTFQKSVLMMSKIEQSDSTGILYYTHFCKHSFFTGSGWQLGTNTTWCITKSKLRMMTQNGKPLIYKVRMLNPGKFL